MSHLEPSKLVRIEFGADDEVHFPLSAHLLVNHDEQHFYIRFYQVTPPVVPEGESLPDVVRAKLVTGVAVPATHLPGIIAALQDNYERFLQRVEHPGAGLPDAEEAT